MTIPVIGITGSNGKTTTKELVAAVLSKKYIVHATKGNLNNHIGVPLTILSTPLDTAIIVCEMGANHVGEIAALCQIAQPTHGLITNIGRAHLEGFGSYEGVKKAKGELFQYLTHHQGTIFINRDDDAVAALGQHAEKSWSYALKPEVNADVHFAFQSKAGVQGFDIADRKSATTIHSPLFGSYNASNALAAYTVGRYFKVDFEAIQSAIGQYHSGVNRSELIEYKGCVIIKDAYNANPTSMELALRDFSITYPHGIVVLGDMKELGAESLQAHQHIISLLKQSSFEKICIVGNEFSSAYNTGTVDDMRIRVFENIQSLKQDWQWTEYTGKQILIKGSRSMQLEQLLT